MRTTEQISSVCVCCGQDLQAMKIGSQHVYKIWRSLVEYRNCVVEVQAAAGDYLYAVQVPAGAGPVGAAVVSPGDATAGDTRPPLGRARIILKDDHNYC